MSELFAAIYNGDLQQVRKLVEQGADIHEYDYSYQDTTKRTPLTHAIIDGAFKNRAVHLPMVKLLLDLGANPAYHAGERSPLADACLHSHPEIARLLIERSADTFWQNSNGFGIFHYAAQGGIDWLILEQLLRGVHPDLSDRNGETALHNTAYGGHIGLSQLLIEHGATVNAVITRGTFKGFTPLRFAVENGYPTITRILLEAGAQVKGFTPHLLRALLGTSRKLGARKPFPEIRQDIARLLLHHARRQPYTVQYPDDPYVQTAQVVLEFHSKLPVTVVHYAAEVLKDASQTEFWSSLGEQDFTALRLLQEHPDIISLSLQELFTKYLVPASKKITPKVIEYLLQAGFDIDFCDEDNNTLLSLAIKAKQHETVRFLLDAGVDIHQTNSARSPLALALDEEDTTIVSWLLETGINPHTFSQYALSTYLFTDNQEVKRMLIEKMPNLTLPWSYYTKTALFHCAITQDDQPFLQLLLENDVHPDTPQDLPLIISPTMQQLLVNAGIPLRKPETFQEAIKVGDRALVERFLEQGATLDQEDAAGNTPLNWAMCARQEAIAWLLLQRGISGTPDQQLTWLIDAVWEMSPELVQTLIRRLETEVYPSPETTIPLFKRIADEADGARFFDDLNLAGYIASDGYRPATLHVLIEAGIDLNAVLETACKEGQIKAIAHLLQYEVELDHKTRSMILKALTDMYEPAHLDPDQWDTLLDCFVDAGVAMDPLIRLVISTNSDNLLRKLAERGFLDVQLLEDGINTPLFLAAEHGALETMTLLLELGADIEAEPSRNASFPSDRNLIVGPFSYRGHPYLTPLHIAVQANQSAALALLLAHGANYNAVSSGPAKHPLDMATDLRSIRDQLRAAGATYIENEHA